MREENRKIRKFISRPDGIEVKVIFEDGSRQFLMPFNRTRIMHQNKHGESDVRYKFGSWK